MVCVTPRLFKPYQRTASNAMLCAKIKGKNIELQKLDKVIRKRVPSGFDIREDIHVKAADFDFDRLHCIKAIGV